MHLLRPAPPFGNAHLPSVRPGEHRERGGSLTTDLLTVKKAELFTGNAHWGVGGMNQLATLKPLGRISVTDLPAATSALRKHPSERFCKLL